MKDDSHSALSFFTRSPVLPAALILKKNKQACFSNVSWGHMSMSFCFALFYFFELRQPKHPSSHINEINKLLWRQIAMRFRYFNFYFHGVCKNKAKSLRKLVCLFSIYNIKLVDTFFSMILPSLHAKIYHLRLFCTIRSV